MADTWENWIRERIAQVSKSASNRGRLNHAWVNGVLTDLMVHEVKQRAEINRLRGLLESVVDDE